MDRLLHLTYLLLLLSILTLEGRGQKATDVVIALEKAGIDKQSAQKLSLELEAASTLYKQLTDSTITYNSLMQYQHHYQTVVGILSDKKIKPNTLMEAFPAAKDIFSVATMRIVKRKAAEMELSDVSIKYKKVFLALEAELAKSEFATKSRRYDAMSQEYLKKIDSWKKLNPEFESFFLDLKLTVSGLNEIYKLLQHHTDAHHLKISKEFRASVKRLRNVDFHHDNEFIQKFKVSSLVEQTIATGEFFCENIK
ncbi:MAG: hypothetical protein RMJ87_00860 [Cytophagales bacterium]|nr:hypothetical protein [Bernardetiaceae bacterium]MDW8203550.1 hypothetical protein [Cytophagales bacterium]